MTTHLPQAPPPAAASAGAPSLEDLFRIHAAKVARWALRFGIASPGDVDDVVQDVFLVVQRRLPDYHWERQGEVTTWLYRITEHVVRKRRSRESWLRRWLRPFEAAKEAPFTGPSPLQQLETRRSAMTFEALLDKLDDKYRHVLVLYEVEQLSGEEIAQLTGLPAATVRVRLHRARQQFDKHLQRLYEQRAKKHE